MVEALDFMKMEEKNAKIVFEDFFYNSPHECSNSKLSSFKIRTILQYLVGINDKNEKKFLV